MAFREIRGSNPLHHPPRTKDQRDSSAYCKWSAESSPNVWQSLSQIRTGRRQHGCRPRFFAHQFGASPVRFMTLSHLSMADDVRDHSRKATIGKSSTLLIPYSGFGQPIHSTVLITASLRLARLPAPRSAREPPVSGLHEIQDHSKCFQFSGPGFRPKQSRPPYRPVRAAP